MAEDKDRLRDWADLVTFERVGARVAEPRVTISKRASIAFNAAFLRKASEQVAGNDYTTLSFSPSNRAVVFDFTDKKESSASLKMSGSGSTKYIAARSFLGYYQIDAEDCSGRYAPKLIDIPGHGKSWVIFLDEKLK